MTQRLKFSERYQVWYRVGSQDTHTLWTMRDYQGLPPLPGTVVLDLGAHIGGYARVALGAGAGVVSVEPESSNFELLAKNVGNEALALYNMAVSSREKVALLRRPEPGARFHDGYSIVPDNPAVSTEWAEEVPTIPMRELLDRWQPELVKCDIEGAEYELPWEFPTCAQALILEYHFFQPGRRAQAHALQGGILRQGFRLLGANPLLTKKHAAVGLYSRR